MLQTQIRGLNYDYLSRVCGHNSAEALASIKATIALHKIALCMKVYRGDVKTTQEYTIGHHFLAIYF